MTPPCRGIWVRDEKKKPTKWEGNKKLTALKFLVQLSQLAACIPSVQAKKALLSCLSCFRLDLQQPPKARVTHMLLRQKRRHKQTFITPSLTVGHHT